MIKWLIIAFIVGVLIDRFVCGIFMGGKISDLYAEIDYLKRSKDGFINEPGEPK